ncbi:NAD-binding protein, partial [Leptolyngbya sp. FACHB-36]|uniref:potassium channel family protein n=1 Tax=Leptolyngbya sp. FACHB-36 TaxID=2692808 RepID=UPI0016802BDC
MPIPPSEATTQLDRYEQPPSDTARFLVCGLGSLGQHCVAVLREFGAVVSAIDQNRAHRWDIPNLLDELEELLIGDCCQTEVLQQANVQNCRAVLLVTSDERVNIEAAFAVRLLNPHVRLVVRSTKQNLNQLLSARLKNFVAFEATQLPAPAFAIAALGSEVRGFIHLGDAMLRVVKDPISPEHRWCDRRVLHELNTPTRRVLSYIPEGSPLPTQFHQWEPNTRVSAGDTVAYVEVTEGLARPDAVPVKPKLTWRQVARTVRSSFSRRGLQQRAAEFWRSTDQQQSKRVAIVLALAIVLLLLVGTGLLAWQQRISGWAAFYTTAMMLLGQTETVIWKTDSKESIPAWLGLMNLVYMLAGTAAIAVLYALLTESLLAAKFQLPKKRPPLPLQDHVVLIGLGRVGRRVATLLQQLRQPLVGVSNRPLDATVLPQMPLVVSDWTNALAKVNLATARSVVVVTDDEMVNLEIGLMAHAANPDRAMVIRTFDPRFGKSVDRFLPTAKVLSAYELAAEAYVAAAFGENILNLIRLNEQTVLVTE